MLTVPYAWCGHTLLMRMTLVEASTILWAFQIAKMENFTSIIVESDSKLCIDAITLHPEDPY
uniref:RNase H type-1 domain-containing protein n=1 Tax=Fagus sylvatica TaxID=28930 RepID=A0A2N9EZY5_FAGSY